ncbi:MAG: hypothetical protein ACYTDY_08220 [Planctomycetota bacterium]|jgi:hypothetical protein
MERKRATRTREEGMALLVVIFFAVTTTLLVGTQLYASLGKVRYVESRAHELRAFNAAESGLNAAIQSVWTTYKNAHPESRVQDLDAFDGKNSDDDQLILSEDLGGGSFTAQVAQVHAVGQDYADVEIVSRGESGSVSRTLTAVVRFGRKPAQVFDYTYFINNFGWLWGAGITSNGPVRSNGDFSVKSPTVNGDIFASENEDLGAEGFVEGNSDHVNIDWYNDHYSTSARPTNPSAPSEDLNGNGELDAGEDANDNGVLDTYEYGEGYDGESEWKEQGQSVKMPYLGDLSIYTGLAMRKGGTLSHGGEVVVNAVLGDDPEEDTNLVLIGTEADPIVINGPVVVTNDIVLKGYITGRGTIYAGRNVHVVGNLNYANPPEWPKPMTDAEAVRDANAVRDMVGLAAKGSIILGDYTEGGWKSATRNYQQPPFTQSYVVDPSDEANGYVSFYDADGRPTFNGDYTAFDGGLKDADGGADPESRRFYESSFSDDFIDNISDQQVTHVDGILYTNHLLSGKIGDSVFNGCLVSRDEAIVYHGHIFLNYDVRVKGGGYEFIDIFLPREATYRTLWMRDGGSICDAETQEVTN